MPKVKMKHGGKSRKKKVNLYFSNRKLYYKRKTIKVKRRKRTQHKLISKSTFEVIESEHIYRNSVAFFAIGTPNGGGDITFRAEVLTNEKVNSNVVQEQLIRHLRVKMQFANKGLKRMFGRAKFIGFEREEIGDNDVTGREKLNRIYTEIL